MKTTFDLTTPEGKMKAFNAKSATTGSLKEFTGELIEVTGLMTYEETVEDGFKTISTLFLKNGEIIGGQSAQAYTQISELIDVVEGMDIENHPITVTIIKSKSNAGRDFLQVKLVSLG